MEIRNLITFLKVAEENSFVRAAKDLGYAQSTISMQMKQLEDELGVLLFERIGKSIHITPQGEKLMDIAKIIVRVANEASNIGRPSIEIDENLRIGLTESLQNTYMSELIHTYHQLNPKSSLTIKATSVEDLIEMLVHNQLDLIFVCNERIRNQQIITAWEKHEPVYFISSPANILQTKKNLTLDDLLNATFLQTESNSSYGLALSRYLADKGLAISSFLDIGNPDIIIDLVAQNDGISFLPEYTIRKRLSEGSIAILNYDTSDINIWIQLLYHKNKFITASMRSFVNLVRKYFITIDNVK